MISHRQEIRDASLLCQPIDQWDIADIELPRDAAVDDGVAALNHEPDRITGRGGSRNRRQHGLHDQLVLGLELDAIVPATSIAVRNE